MRYIEERRIQDHLPFKTIPRFPQEFLYILRDPPPPDPPLPDPPGRTRPESTVNDYVLR
jgi:hypothetical protein